MESLKHLWGNPRDLWTQFENRKINKSRGIDSRFHPMDGNCWAHLLLSRVLFQLSWYSIASSERQSGFQFFTLCFHGRHSGPCLHYCQYPLLPVPASGFCHLWCMLNIWNRLIVFLKHFYHATLLLKNLQTCLITTTGFNLPCNLHPHPHAISVVIHCVWSHLQALMQAVPAWNTPCRPSPIPSSSANSYCSSLYIIFFGNLGT